MKYINEWSLDQIKSHLDFHVSTYKDTQILSAEVAGEGNMNFTLRLKLNSGESLIMKQSPPFCAKFPSIPAPQMRIESEQVFYKIANTNKKIVKFSPQILGFDSEEKVLYMTDLGSGKDYEDCYSGYKLKESELKILCNYLSELHSIKCTNIDFDNVPMKKLNHAYIFELPFKGAKEAIDLDKVTKGLSDLSEEIKNMDALKNKISSLGEVYLKDSLCLIHGDFYPRSWLKTDNGLFIIDPEFGFVGRPEFDLGVFLAHMAMSEQFKPSYKYLKANYKSNDSFDWDLCLDFCAVEILRRLLYVSQLPLKNNLTYKNSLYQSSVKRIIEHTEFEDIA